jgi:hypothetical protein
MHVAFETAGTLFGRVVEVVLPGAVFGSHMAAVAEGVSIYIYLTAMGFMAVLADHPGLIHFALQKGSIHIYLIQNLTVREIKILFQ